ncbi:YciI family protein [Brevibacterium oceani]|uniref:YciI family protein n=1 Tax=Brevibacterium oceani TaxID=358099 RepID=UPI001B333E99|nr:YciI family protein [Brevibacterium oceani]
MSIFIVRLEHPDEAGWQEWVGPHVEWVREHVAAGTIIASGPSVGTDIRQGWLVMRAVDEPELRQYLASDPFWQHGIVENLLIVEWDPIFGELDRLSSSPGGVPSFGE